MGGGEVWGWGGNCRRVGRGPGLGAHPDSGGLRLPSVRHLRLDGSVALVVVPDRRRKVAFYEPAGIIEPPPPGSSAAPGGNDGFMDRGGPRVSGTDLNAPRAALDAGQGF